MFKLVTELGSIAVKAAIKRAGISCERVQEVLMGNVLSAGVSTNPTRQATLGRWSSGVGAVHHHQQALCFRHEDHHVGRPKPHVRLAVFADTAVEPLHFCIFPAYAMPKALNQAGLTLQDMSMIEINKAFSDAVLRNMKHLGLDHSKVNVHGGAVSLGHPLGIFGARITGRLALHLQPGQYGLAEICNGGGGGSAIIIEKL
ncbi:hypothetical protein MRX96_004890 [Rhipicephalus microplus]